MDSNETDLIKLCSPRMQKKLTELQKKYTETTDSFEQKIGKIIRGLETEALSRAKDIHIQASIQLSLCEINLWELELKQLKNLLRLCELESSETDNRQKIEEECRTLQENYSHLLVEKENLRLTLRRAFLFASKLAENLISQDE